MRDHKEVQSTFLVIPRVVEDPTGTLDVSETWLCAWSTDERDHAQRIKSRWEEDASSMPSTVTRFLEEKPVSVEELTIEVSISELSSEHPDPYRLSVTIADAPDGAAVFPRVLGWENFCGFESRAEAEAVRDLWQSSPGALPKAAHEELADSGVDIEDVTLDIEVREMSEPVE